MYLNRHSFKRWTQNSIRRLKRVCSSGIFHTRCVSKCNKGEWYSEPKSSQIFSLVRYYLWCWACAVTTMILCFKVLQELFQMFIVANIKILGIMLISQMIKGCKEKFFINQIFDENIRCLHQGKKCFLPKNFFPWWRHLIFSSKIWLIKNFSLQPFIIWLIPNVFFNNQIKAS